MGPCAQPLPWLCCVERLTEAGRNSDNPKANGVVLAAGTVAVQGVQR